jgi:hypothetical protein
VKIDVDYASKPFGGWSPGSSSITSSSSQALSLLTEAMASFAPGIGVSNSLSADKVQDDVVSQTVLAINGHS